jgi:hypothetical protein
MGHGTEMKDTAILLAAVEHAPASGPAPIKTDLTMEEAAWFLFNKDDARRPHFCGNAGNDAFVRHLGTASRSDS